MECCDKCVYHFSLLLQLLIKMYTLVHVNGVSVLNEVPSELLLDNAVLLSISLVQSKASKNVLRFLPHCIDEGTELDWIVSIGES